MVNNSAKNLSLTFFEEPWNYNEPQCLLSHFIQHQLPGSQEVIVVRSNCSNMHGQVMPQRLHAVVAKFNYGRLLLAGEAELWAQTTTSTCIWNIFKHSFSFFLVPIRNMNSNVYIIFSIESLLRLCFFLTVQSIPQTQDGFR